VPPENVVAPANVFFKPQSSEEMAQIVEIDVRVRRALQNSKSKFLMLAHAP
jgi:hypothetical protein